MVSSSELIQIARPTDKVAVVTLNSPSNLNALSQSLVTQLCSVIRRLDEDREGTAVVVLTGCLSGNCFSSGFDVAELEHISPRKTVEKLENVVDTLDGLSVPLVAAVAGIAFGGGCELALGCDIIYSTADARFALPEVKLGLVAAGGGLRQLSRWVAPGRAAYLAMTGEEWTGSEAERWGMVKTCFKDFDFCLKGAISCATRIASNGSDAVRASKRLMRASTQMAACEVIKLEHEEFESLLGGKEHIQRRSAWLARKRIKSSTLNGL